MDQHDEVVWLSVDEPPEPRRPRYGLYALGFVLLLVGVGGGVAMVAKVASMLALDAGSTSVTRRMRPSEVYQESARVFSEYDAAAAPGQDPDAEELASLLSVVEQIGECSAADDDERFAELVDVRRLHKRVELTGVTRDWSAMDKIQLRMIVRQMVVVEDIWRSPRVGLILAESRSSSTLTSLFSPSSLVKTDARSTAHSRSYTSEVGLKSVE